MIYLLHFANATFWLQVARDLHRDSVPADLRVGAELDLLVLQVVMQGEECSLQVAPFI